MDHRVDDTTPASLPPSRQWTFSGDAWALPASTASPAPPATAPSGRDRAPRRGVLSGAGAVLLALAKYGSVLLKAGKLGPTFISMAISLVLLTQLYGFAFGLGLLLLIAVHESGHMLFARHEGVPVSAPIFLGIFGAVIGMKQPPRDARQEAVIAIGGPVVGSLGALAVYVLALATPPGHTHLVLTAIAYVGFFINLFNLIPVVPLDGGRVASAVSVWFNVIGLVIVALLLVASTASHLSQPLLLIVLILGAYTTWKRFQTARRNPDYLAAVPARTRVAIGGAYVTMLALTALGMAATHAGLVDAGVLSVR